MGIAAPDDARRDIEGLVQRFGRNLDLYTRPDYKETQVRVEFIDPFFEALGWDVRNVQGYAEPYKDVVHEDAIKISGATKAPDYCFRVGGVRKFFLEAKRPSVPVKGEIGPAYQLRRYAWSAKLPLSILTDFQEFAVYDCRQRPQPRDKAGVGRVVYYTFQDYLDHLDELYSIFAREAVLKGSFDRYVEDTRRKRGTSEVDVEFLKEIEGWRQELARNLALRNPNLSVHELNFAVQRTIDRIIFLRMCEDRGIEGYGALLGLTAGPHIYARLGELYREADQKYNSDLFDFRNDTLTKTLDIDDRTLKPILAGLYYPDSPYEFSVLPTEILGQVYEQFLGKVIRLTPGHRAKVEEKPEVKKAGGVYYTPSYIVEYIVEQTVGRLIEGQTPQQISKQRFLDPACGSGSFLLGAYQRLLDYHRRWYEEHDPEKLATGKRPPIYQGRGGEWRLTTGEKKRILLNNIYGVDIDRQAVEVTKLSLLLRVLEGENQESLGQQLRLWRERALPDLGENIKCGNSLIGPGYFAGQLLPDEEEMRRVNPFDWEKEFPEIMEAGGFDAVIGNPPYGFREIHPDAYKAYFKAHYAAAHGSFEHYFLFYERSLRLIKENGRHSFIVPVTWLSIPSARSLRKFILDDYRLEAVCWLPQLVFAKAQVNTLISVIAKGPSSTTTVQVYDKLGFREPPAEERKYKQSYFVASDYYIGIFEREADRGIIRRMQGSSQPVAAIATPRSGYNPYEKGKGIAPDGGPHTAETVRSKPYHSQSKLGPEWKPEIVGRDLGRYSVVVSGNRWIKYGPWLAAPREPSNFVGPRLLVQEITGGPARRIVAAYYHDELYHSRDVIPIKTERDLPHPFYILGILNSRLMTWYHHRRSPKAKKELFPKLLVSDLRTLPIRRIDFDHPEDVARHDKMVALVERMLELHKKLAAATIPADNKLYQRQIEATDAGIDALAYELYGLSDEEIAIVEGRD